MFPARHEAVPASSEASPRLKAWLWAMLVAPFAPWFTFPIPIATFFVIGLLALPAALLSGSLPSGANLGFSGLIPVLGFLWTVTAFLAFVWVRRRDWRNALWTTLTNLGCGVTLLATFLLITGLGPVEPFGYISPPAFLALAALPAAYEIAGRWLAEIHRRQGPEAERAARSRLLALGLGYAFAFTACAVALAVSAATAIQRLPAPQFYWQEQTIRESSAVTFALLGVVQLGVFLALGLMWLGRRTTGPERGEATSADVPR